MPSQKPISVIVDTNLWISFLIGKELHILKNLIASQKLELIITDQLMEEIILVTKRDKLKKYFSHEKVEELTLFLSIVSKNVKIDTIESVCRDPKDDFLLALSKKSEADYLITGDMDLLEIKRHHKTEIVSITKFIEIVS